MKFTSALVIIALFSSVAQARVFDINRDSMAPYVSFSGGPSALGSKAFENEATSVSVSGETKYNYGGEFGFLLSRRLVNVAFGIGILKPSPVNNISGADGGGTQVYSGESEILGFVPKVSVEFNLHGDNQSRSFISVSGGLASVTLKNSYTLTAAGTTAYPGVDTVLESKGSGTELAAGIGYEGVLSDSVTYAFQFGYKQLKIDNLKYSKDYNTFNGAVSSGAAVMNGSSSRVLDLSGGFISLGFRFYM